jgi:hypothetical protein
MVTVEKYNKINQILSEWNPLSIDHYIANEEYKDYIPLIYDAATDVNI